MMRRDEARPDQSKESRTTAPDVESQTSGDVTTTGDAAVADDAPTRDAEAVRGASAPSAFATATAAISRGLAWVLVAPIWLYQRLLSPLWPGTCKFHPSCSHYASESLLTHGPVKGLLLTARRLGRCHPWQLGGIDPVPARGRWTPDVDLMGRPITDGNDATEERVRVHH